MTLNNPPKPVRTTQDFSAHVGTSDSKQSMPPMGFNAATSTSQQGIAKDVKQQDSEPRSERVRRHAKIPRCSQISQCRPSSLATPAKLSSEEYWKNSQEGRAPRCLVSYLSSSSISPSAIPVAPGQTAGLQRSSRAGSEPLTAWCAQSDL